MKVTSPVYPDMDKAAKPAAGPGIAVTGMSIFPGPGHQGGTGVGKSWCAGITYQSHGHAGLQLTYQFRTALSIIMSMVTDQWLGYLVMIQKFPGPAGIFGSDEIHCLKNVKGSQSNIFQVADGGGDHI